VLAAAGFAAITLISIGGAGLDDLRRYRFGFTSAACS